MGSGSLPGVKQQSRGVNHPTQSDAEVKAKVELYLYSHSGPLWPVLGRTLPLKARRADGANNKHTENIKIASFRHENNIKIVVR